MRVVGLAGMDVYMFSAMGYIFFSIVELAVVGAMERRSVRLACIPFPFPFTRPISQALPSLHPRTRPTLKSNRDDKAVSRPSPCAHQSYPYSLCTLQPLMLSTNMAVVCRSRPQAVYAPR